MLRLIVVAVLFSTSTAIADTASHPQDPISFGAYILTTAAVLAVVLPVFGFILKHFQSREMAALRLAMETGFGGIRTSLADRAHTVSNNRSEIDRLAADLGILRQELRDRCAALEKSHSSCQNGRREFESNIQLGIKDQLAAITLGLADFRGALERLQEGMSRDFRDHHAAVKADVLEELMPLLTRIRGT